MMCCFMVYRQIDPKIKAKYWINLLKSLQKGHLSFIRMGQIITVDLMDSWSALFLSFEILRPSGWLRYATHLSNWLMDSDWSAADQNLKQTLSRQIDMPESDFMNPFQLFPITRLLHFGPYLCPEVCIKAIHGKPGDRAQWKELH